MAIAFDNATDGGQASATSLTFSHTITKAGYGANVLFVTVYDQNATVTGVTYAGVSMTAVPGWSSGGLGAYYFYLFNPTNGVNNVVVTKSAGTATVQAIASSYNGTTGSLDSHTTSLVNTSSPATISTTVVASNCWTIGMSFGTTNSSGPITINKTSRITRNFNDGSNRQCILIGDSNAIVGTGGQSIVFTLAGSLLAFYSGVLSIAPYVPVPYSASLTTGYFSLTGYSAIVLKTHGYLVSLATGYYSLTGNSTSLIKHITTSLTTGYYTLTGYTSTLTRQISASLQTGYYNLYGFAQRVFVPTILKLQQKMITTWNNILKD